MIMLTFCLDEQEVSEIRNKKQEIRNEKVFDCIVLIYFQKYGN